MNDSGVDVRAITRVLIIGAGPGGLAAARLLRERGYRDITILEKRDRAGGMCHSITHGGKWFDVGANYVTQDYREVRALAKELDLQFVTDKAFQNQESLDVETGVVSDAQKVINSGHSMLAFGIASLRYFWFQRKYRHVVNAPGYLGVSTEEDLMQSFGEWLRLHKMGPLQKLLMVPITAMGFGTLEEIPAPHGLRYVNASRFWSMLKTGLHIPQSWPKRFEGGFGSAWVKLAAQFNVEYETETVAVDRGEFGVRVVTKDKGGTEQTRTFDSLVVAIPPNAALDFLDATPFEKDLFGGDTVQFNHYSVATALVKNFPGWVVNTLQPTTHDRGAYPPPIGHPYIFGKQWKESDLTLYYAPLGAGVDSGEAQAQMQADSSLLGSNENGYQFDNWTTFNSWPRYFPRVSVDDMRSFQGGAGWYDQVEALQGHNRTVYCHGMLSFELVESVMRYARNLVEKHFN